MVFQTWNDGKKRKKEAILLLAYISDISELFDMRTLFLREIKRSIGSINNSCSEPHPGTDSRKLRHVQNAAHRQHSFYGNVFGLKRTALIQ